MSKNKDALMGAFTIPSPRPAVNPHAPPPPSTTAMTTPQPTPDPHEYEKSMFKDQVPDRRALDYLKDQIRSIRGLQTVLPEARKRTVSARLRPKVPPRANETSRIRAEMRKYRLIQRCGEFTKYFMGQHSELFDADKPLTPEQEQELVNKAKQLNAEEIAMEKREAEAEYLKYLASKIRTAKDYKPRANRASEYRFKHNRGEPILSTNFLSNYNYHEKPPFHVSKQYKPIPRWKLPPIDKNKEAWLIPQEDADIPLHVIPRIEPEKPPSKRGARPPLKVFSRSTKPYQPPKPTKKPPWNYHIPTGYMKDSSESQSQSHFEAKSSQQSEPVDSDRPVRSARSVESDEPIRPSIRPTRSFVTKEPTQTTKSIEAVESVRPTQLSETEEFLGPTKSTGMDESIEPTKSRPTKSTEMDDSIQPSKSGPTKSTGMDEFTKPTKSGPPKSTGMDEFTKPTKSGPPKSIGMDESIKPTKSSQSKEPINIVATAAAYRVAPLAPTMIK